MVKAKSENIKHKPFLTADLGGIPLVIASNRGGRESGSLVEVVMQAFFNNPTKGYCIHRIGPTSDAQVEGVQKFLTIPSSRAHKLGYSSFLFHKDTCDDELTNDPTPRLIQRCEGSGRDGTPQESDTRLRQGF